MIISSLLDDCLEINDKILLDILSQFLIDMKCKILSKQHSNQSPSSDSVDVINYGMRFIVSVSNLIIDVRLVLSSRPCDNMKIIRFGIEDLKSMNKFMKLFGISDK